MWTVNILVPSAVVCEKLDNYPPLRIANWHPFTEALNPAFKTFTAVDTSSAFPGRTVQAGVMSLTLPDQYKSMEALYALVSGTRTFPGRREFRTEHYGIVSHTQRSLKELLGRSTQSGIWPMAFFASSSVAALTAVTRRSAEKETIF